MGGPTVTMHLLLSVTCAKYKGVVTVPRHLALNPPLPVLETNVRFVDAIHVGKLANEERIEALERNGCRTLISQSDHC